MKIFIKVRGILQNIPWVTIVLKTEKCRYNIEYIEYRYKGKNIEGADCYLLGNHLREVLKDGVEVLNRLHNMTYLLFAFPQRPR